MKYEQLDRLNSLKEKGAITEDEYQREKEKILNGVSTPAGNMLGLDTNTYSMLIHLSQLLGILIPLAGMIVPVVLWSLNKDQNPIIDRHGKIVVNWIITCLILFTVFGILSFLIIGIPLLILFAIADFIFIILGGLKAKAGEFYRYPFSFQFIKV